MCSLSAIAVAVFGALAPSAAGFTTDTGTKMMVSDGSYADTAAAINAARARNEDGWTLTVGQAGGNYTWASQLVLDIPRDFTLQGASATTPTTINSTYTGPIAIFINAGTNKVTTMRNFKFSGWRATGRLIQIAGTGECFHLSNLTVSASYESTGWLWVGDPATPGNGDGPFGLIDHSTFNGYCGVFVRQNLASSDANWPNDHPITWGSRKAVFIEDCTYTGATEGAPSVVSDGNQGGKLVVRHCVMNNASVAWHGRDSGGVVNQQFKQGFLSGEVYQNTYNVTRGMGVPLVMVRSGTALVWGNALNVSGAGALATGVQLQMHCASPYEFQNCLQCNGGAPMLRPLTYPDDYPDCQQPGTPQPVRVWSNSNAGAILYGWCVGDSSFSAPNREYFVSSDASAKPAGYVPFTYPHPLQGAGGTPRPSPPSNLHVAP